MKIIDSKLQGNVLQEFTDDYLEKHKELIKYVKEETKKQLTLTDVIVSSCCKGTGFIELPNGEDCYCFCEIGKKQRSQQYKL